LTLIELMLVLVLMAVAVALVAPNLYDFYQDRELHNTAEGIVALTREARSLAKRSGIEVRIYVDTETGKYWLRQVDQANESESNEPASDSEIFSVPENIEISWGLDRDDRDDAVDASLGQYMKFSPDGRTVPASLCLTDNQGGKIWIECNKPTTGFEISKVNE